MTQKTPLENLLEKTGYSIPQFANKVGKKYPAFRKQLLEQQHNHVQLAFEYGLLLHYYEHEGYINGKHVKITVTPSPEMIKEIPVVYEQLTTDQLNAIFDASGLTDKQIGEALGQSERVTYYWRNGGHPTFENEGKIRQVFENEIKELKY